VKLGVDTRRWAGVPFYLRTGKRLPRRMTEIALMFQRAPHLPFNATDTKELGHNAMVIRVQPDEGVTVRFGSKVPGSAMEVRDVNMDFAYGESFTENSPEAYERLLLDVLIGDPPLFPRHQEVELSWEVLDPVEEFWAEHGKPDQYPAGSTGPGAAVVSARSTSRWSVTRRSGAIASSTASRASSCRNATAPSGGNVTAVAVGPFNSSHDHPPPPASRIWYHHRRAPIVRSTTPCPCVRSRRNHWPSNRPDQEPVLVWWCERRSSLPRSKMTDGWRV